MGKTVGVNQDLSQGIEIPDLHGRKRMRREVQWQGRNEQMQAQGAATFLSPTQQMRRSRTRILEPQ